jgi:hypothetical protein
MTLVFSLKQNLRHTPDQRRGVAVVELAICLPLLILIVFATIETCRMIHLQQMLKVTAYEGARIGITPHATFVNVNFQCETLLDSQNIKDYSISLNPADPSMLTPGDFFEVTLTVDYAPNALLGNWFFSGQQLTQTCALRTDYGDTSNSSD